MNCLECGGTYIEKSGTYELIDPYVGKIIVQGVTYYRCDKCKDVLYSEAMAQAIESERRNRIHEILIQYPITDFINATETASMLGISRQALHKNLRINHGFIYHAKFFGITVYLNQSVQLYKRTGDGRFSLHSYGYSPAEYLQDTIPIRISSAYKSYPRTRKSMNPFITEKRVRSKEYNYVN